MITLYAAMLVTLGFLLAALLAVLLLPAYRRRIERFTSESVRRALPLTDEEIRADKDRLKAEYAMDVHKLDSKLDEAAITAARQRVEINRRDARVHELEQAISAQKLQVEEHENARRVLEQAILDRLPKVEQRLTDARKLLAERDADITLLADTSAKQTAALEEATQINLQQSEDLHRLRAALDTRAARPRESVGDPRFDGEVALRTEIEMLRSKTRDQSALIRRLQVTAAGADSAAINEREAERLRAGLAKAEAELLQLKSSEDSGEASRARLEARIVEFESERSDRLSEVAKLKGALKSYEAGDGAASSALSGKAEIAALQAEVDQQRLTIQSLRADIASGNERLARQSQHFRDEVRRLGGNAFAPTDGGRQIERESPRLTLAERLASPRPPRAAGAVDGAGELKVVNGGDVSDLDDAVEIYAPGSAEKAAADASPRRPRLLERLGGIDKS